MSSSGNKNYECADFPHPKYVNKNVERHMDDVRRKKEEKNDRGEGLFFFL
jgi:hypothetical protein